MSWLILVLFGFGLCSDSDSGWSCVFPFWKICLVSSYRTSLCHNLSCCLNHDYVLWSLMLVIWHHIKSLFCFLLSFLSLSWSINIKIFESWVELTVCSVPKSIATTSFASFYLYFWLSTACASLIFRIKYFSLCSFHRSIVIFGNLLAIWSSQGQWRCCLSLGLFLLFLLGVSPLHSICWCGSPLLFLLWWNAIVWWCLM